MNLGNGLNKKVCYIVDLIYKDKDIDLSLYCNEKTYNLALTPYSFFLLENLNIQYTTFHESIISVKSFYQKAEEQYNILKKVFIPYKDYQFLLRDIAKVLTYNLYCDTLIRHIETLKKQNYNIVYITDNPSSNHFLNLHDKKLITQTVTVEKESFFYHYNKMYYRILQTFNTNIFSLVKKLLNKGQGGGQFNYDNINYQLFFTKIKLEPFTVKIDLSLLENLQMDLKRSDIEFDLMPLIRSIENDNTKNMTLHPFTFLATYKDYKDILLYKLNNIPRIFMQHGSYLQENLFVQYNEIFPADVNFVFNEYTKRNFQRKNAQKVYNVGSINFNYAVKKRKQEYDYLYITYCSSYDHLAPYISNFKNSLAMDAFDIYKRHQSIIELFGTKFKDKKLCMKIQPGIMNGSMLYIPLMELSNKYENITIEFSVPIAKLIEKSKYIVSDYFSSDFINRELHYKRDIIMFGGAPTPLPEEVYDDMQKMFILVNSVQELENTLKDIETISKNRTRNDEIIEYYSSRKCDTKKLVTQVLEKELYEKRR